MQRETMEFDAVIVGAGPAGLAAAIRLRQLAAEAGRDFSVCVVEKAGELGAHCLAGAVLEPRALLELFPDADARAGAPLQTPVTEDEFALLTAKYKLKLPTPPAMRNDGNFVISISRFVRWLGEQAEGLGADIFTGFAAAEVLYDQDGKVAGVATGDAGVGKDGQPGANFQRGVELRAPHTFFAEGCRGALSQQLIARFDLQKQAGAGPQTYGIGLKELWEVEEAQSRPGRVFHSVGWPLASNTYGGSFLYHPQAGKVAVGFVVGLDYQNPHLSPYEEFQRFKHHPAVAAVLTGGRRIAYGARALNEGGWQSLPKLSMPGASLLGCAAGTLNVAKIKGIHTAMKSGMLAAESLFASQPAHYDAALRASWVGGELRAARNLRPGFRWGLWGGMAHAALDTYIFRGHAPWTLQHHADHAALKPARDCPPITYPKPDGKLSFAKLENLSFSGVRHEENQPCHLQLKDGDLPIHTNLREYDSPESRYCPAGVYEIVEDAAAPRLVINAANCLHCKTCDIKDPRQNIVWTAPEGGGGPQYGEM